MTSDLKPRGPVTSVSTIGVLGPAPIVAGDLEIDVRARRVRLHGEPVTLTTREFDLLAFLAARSGLVFSREDLLRTVWHSEPGWQQAATVTEHVRRLRLKIERDPHAPGMLQTVRGVGYRFDLPADARGPLSQPLPAMGSLIEIDGEIVGADEDAAGLFGVGDAGELIGRTMIDLVAPGWRAAFRARKDMIVGGASPRSQVLGVVASDGSELLVEMRSAATEWHGRPARTKTLVPLRRDGDPLRHLVTGVFSDVTDAVIVTDASFHVRSWNDAARGLFGWSQDEAMGRHVFDLIPWSGDVTHLLRAWGELDETGRWSGEARHLTREGTEIAVTASVTRIADDQGTPVAVVTVNRPLRHPLRRTGPGERSTMTGADIRRELATGEFVVRYQPIVSLPDAQLVTVQALLRWEHPRHGTLLPHQVIGTAGNEIAHADLTAFVLEEACRTARGWQVTGVDVDVAVAVSGRELRDRSVVDRIAGVLADTELDAGRLWIEVREHAVATHVDAVQPVLRRLSDRGIGIAIDRFGSGAASLGYLRHVPIDAIKIDPELIAGVATHASDRALVRSMVGLGAEIGVLVVADGIETLAQARTLTAIGCTMGQGDLYGAAVPVEHLRVTSGARGHGSTSRDSCDR